MGFEDIGEAEADLYLSGFISNNVNQASFMHTWKRSHTSKEGL